MNDSPLKPADQGRDSRMDKTDAAQADGDAYAN